MQALVIRDTGEVERLWLPTFEDLQKACGGTRIRHLSAYEQLDGLKEREHVDGELVESPSILAPEFAHLTMWCNEEAQVLETAENRKATRVLGWWGAEYPDGQKAMLYGDVVITGTTDARSGNRTTLKDLDMTALKAACVLA
jgi:hypothetical protein